MEVKINDCSLSLIADSTLTKIKGNDIQDTRWEKVKRILCCKKKSSNLQRTIHLNRENETIFPNIIKNHRYNLFTFIPFVIFEQLQHFSNQFYVLLLVSQFLPWFKVGFIIDYLTPIIIVFTITFVKESYDDYHRHKKDNEANNQEVIKITKEGKRKKIKSKDIKVGDNLEISKDQRLCADIVILKTNHPQGRVYIRTDQLDGETDWKLRKAPVSTQHMSEEELFELNADLIVDPPSTFIYEFRGVLNIHKPGEFKESLSLENTLWSNTILATDHCIGVVIYTGKETRFQMNNSKPKAKFGVLDYEINNFNKILFAMLFFLALSVLILRGFNPVISDNFVAIVRYIVLFCSILPIGLRVNMEISKTINSSLINKNQLSPDTIVRNSTMPEELGRIEFIFSDKTGTLTKNEMIFKQLLFDNHFSLNEENVEDCKKMLEEHDLRTSSLEFRNSLEGNSSYGLNAIKGRAGSKNKKKNKGRLLKETMIALALCNNVTPITEVKSDNGMEEIKFQASSPDELALVNISKTMGLALEYRDEKLIRLRNAYAKNELKEFEILACFPFTSENKRMGILIRNKDDGLIYLYLKGSENVILNFVDNEYHAVIQENTDYLASQGLRTLVVTQKVISEEFYQKWIEEYHLAMISMENRNEKVQKKISELEESMEFLCVTGVDDILQNNVVETIESLKQAGIKLWMLTGDKVETATCIAISAGIKRKTDQVFYIKENLDENYVEDSLKEFSKLANNVLIIDGNCLDIALSKFEKLFFTSTLCAPAVVCCRCSPTQKAKIVSNFKKYSSKRTLAIGDGGNDVAMIQEANCGVGIVGKEGKQASLAGDYSITEFHHIQYLILWFGRQSYKNTASICYFVLHRGMIITFMQYIFCVMVYYFPIPLYNGFLIMGYTSIYTNFPIFTLLLDRDTKLKNVLKFPRLYKQLQKRRELSLKMFLFWSAISLFQASIIMFGIIFIFQKQVYLNLITLTFTNLIFAELLNLCTMVKRFHWLMLISIFGTLVIYLLSMIFLRSIIDIDFLFHNWAALKVFGIAVINWLPVFLHKKLKARLFPQEHEKLNRLQSNEQTIDQRLNL